NIGLERAFLREGVSGQGRALRALRYFYADRGGIGGGDSSGAQHGELRKDFVVDLGDQVILTIGFAAPDLAELNGIDCHRTFPDSRWVASRLPGCAGRVNSQRGYRGPTRGLAIGRPNS